MTWSKYVSNKVIIVINYEESQFRLLYMNLCVKYVYMSIYFHIMYMHILRRLFYRATAENKNVEIERIMFLNLLRNCSTMALKQNWHQEEYVPA
jgi:hypothetical protein